MIGWLGRRDADGSPAPAGGFPVTTFGVGASPSEDGQFGLRVRATGSVAPATSLGRDAWAMKLRGVVPRKEPCGRQELLPPLSAVSH